VQHAYLKTAEHFPRLGAMINLLKCLGCVLPAKVEEYVRSATVVVSNQWE
jgi:hypothetical protein